MNRAAEIKKLQDRRETIEKWMHQMQEYLGPYPTGPGRCQLIEWQMVLDEIDSTMADIGSSTAG